MSEWKAGDPERRSPERAEEVLRNRILQDAVNAAKTVSDASAAALKVIAEAAASANALVNLDMGYIKKEMLEIKLMLESKYITKDQFSPVKVIVYGFVAIVLTAVIGALLTLVIIKGSNG